MLIAGLDIPIQWTTGRETGSSSHRAGKATVFNGHYVTLLHSTRWSVESPQVIRLQATLAISRSPAPSKNNTLGSSGRVESSKWVTDQMTAISFDSLLLSYTGILSKSLLVGLPTKLIERHARRKVRSQKSAPRRSCQRKRTVEKVRHTK